MNDDAYISNGLIESISQTAGESSAQSSVIASEVISQSALDSRADTSVVVVEVISQIIYPSDAQTTFVIMEAIVPVSGAQVLPIF